MEQVIRTKERSPEDRVAIEFIGGSLIAPLGSGTLGASTFRRGPLWISLRRLRYVTNKKIWHLRKGARLASGRTSIQAEGPHWVDCSQSPILLSNPASSLNQHQPNDSSGVIVADLKQSPSMPQVPGAPWLRSSCL